MRQRKGGTTASRGAVNGSAGPDGTSRPDGARGADRPPRATRYRLDVTGGPQRGARALVDAVAGSTLGSALESDVVLLDPGVEAHALVFEAGEGGALAIRVRGGELRRDGAPLAGDGPHPHADGATYRLGSTSFTLTGVPTDEAPETARSASGAVASGAAADEAVTGKTAANGTATGEAAPSEARAARSSSASVPPSGGRGWPGMRRAMRIGGGGDGDPGGEPDGDGSDDGASAPDDEGGDTLLPTLLFGVAALLCVAVGISYVLHAPAATPRATSTASVGAPAQGVVPSGLERRLREAGFDTVALADDGPGAAPRLAGHVPSRRRLNELERLARAMRPSPRIDVHVQNDIVEGVRDVYRTNGVDAVVESTGPGSVRVLTAERAPRDPAFMKAAAMEDVAGLSTIEVRNEPPPAAVPEPAEPLEPPRAPSVEEVGKQVVSIIQGVPSYVVTEDGARYFVGSLLPTGHTIAAIEGRSVMLEWQNRKTRLEF